MRGSDAEKSDAATTDNGALALGVVSGCGADFAVGGVNRHTADIVKGRKRPEGAALIALGSLVRS